MTPFSQIVADAKVRLSSAPAEEWLQWAASRFAPRAGISCSFGGPGGIVLAHMTYRLGLALPLLFVDTEFLFAETYRLKKTLETTWGLEVRTARPSLSPTEQARAFGDRLWEKDPDRCCRLRKVEPMQELLSDIDCWITALRRDQSASRAQVEYVEVHVLADGREIVKLNPLCRWTRRDVWDYIIRHRLPYNPLLDQGYKSLGCTHCTVPAEGADERAGRWQGHAKTECGLHTFTQRRSGRGCDGSGE